MAVRREFLASTAALLAAPWTPARAAQGDFDAALHALTFGAPLGDGRVQLRTPRLADNGLSVPLEVRVDSPMTPADHVLRIALLSDRNPRALIASFAIGSFAGRAMVTTRVRLSGSQRVWALAQLSDGSWWQDSAEVEVTESACLDTP